jgi:hypothetical protein
VKCFTTRPGRAADRERFFERAWTRSKEVAAMLGFALLLGTDAVREDLLALAASVGVAGR